MPIHLLETKEELEQYDCWIKAHPDGSLWQSLAWKRYQEALGRDVRIYVNENRRSDDPMSYVLSPKSFVASALVVIDRTSFSLSTWEIPCGPLYAVENGTMKEESFLSYIIKDAKRDRCFSLFVSPSQPCSLSTFHFPLSTRHTMPQATRQIDLTKTEEEILAQMHPKGRYNIRVAAKNDVRVERSEDTEAFYTLIRMTAKRDRFTHPPRKHYQSFLQSLDGSFLFLAYNKQEIPIAGLMGVHWNGTGIYYYGASSYGHRALMAPYLLQWEAMKYCKAKGCTTYDLFGIAPEGDADHPWKSVSDFKSKFGGTIISYPPEQQIVLRPWANVFVQMKRKLLG